MAHRAAYDGADRRGGNAASDAIARLLMRYPNVGSATARGNGATDGGGASHSTLRAAYAAGRNNAHSAVTPRRELEETYQRQRLAESQVQQLSAELVRQRHLAATAQVQSKNAASINARLEEEMRRMRSTNEALVARAREANGFVSEWKRRYDELHHMNEMLKWRFHESNRQYGAVSLQMKADNDAVRAEARRQRATASAERRLRSRCEASLERERRLRQDAERSHGIVPREDVAAAPAPAGDSPPCTSHAVELSGDGLGAGLVAAAAPAPTCAWWQPVPAAELGAPASPSRVVVALVAGGTPHAYNPRPASGVVRVLPRSLRKVRTSSAAPSA